MAARAVGLTAGVIGHGLELRQSHRTHATPYASGPTHLGGIWPAQGKRATTQPATLRSEPPLTRISEPANEQPRKKSGFGWQLHQETTVEEEALGRPPAPEHQEVSVGYVEVPEQLT